MHPLIRLHKIGILLNQDKKSHGDPEDEDFKNYKIYLPMRVNNVTVVGMMDSGNLWRVALSWAMAQKMGLRRKDLRVVQGYEKIGTAANEGQLEVMGETIKKIMINLGGGTRDIPCRPVVIKNLSMPLNVSGPFMKKHRIDLLHTGEAVLQGKKIQMQTKGGDFGKMADAHSLIYTTEDVTVGAMERCWIPAVAKSVQHGDIKAEALLVMGDGAYTERYDLHPMTNAHVNCDKDGKMMVMTLNTTGRDIRVRKGSIYGIGFQTTTPQQFDDEPWKICLLDHNLTDDSNQTATGKVPKTETDKSQENPDDVLQWKKKNKIPEEFDIDLESYLAGTKMLPCFMCGPTKSVNRKKRIAFLLKFFKLENNNFLKDPKDLKATLKLLLDYFEVWAFNGNFGKTHLIEHKIILEPDTKPIHERYRPPNPLLEDSMKKQLNTWLRHEVIEESNSPWNFSLVAAVKKGGKVRWCTDWRGE